MIAADGDESCWEEPVTAGTVGIKARLADRHSRGGTFGLRLFWKDTGVGGEFLFFTEGDVSFCASHNRRVLVGRLTDVSWYIEKLIPCLESLPLDGWQWSEL